MASDTTGNGPTPPQAGAAPVGAAELGPQQLIVNAQYIKDLSFENPRAPASFRQTTQPGVEINVDVKAQGMGPDTFEVVLTINASAKVQEEALFLAELSYAGLVTVRNVPQDMLTSVVLVETPRLLFPFARNIIADITRDGGYPPLLINPIDFSELLRRNSAGAAEAGVTPPTAGA
ncbi:MAG: protein-export chaperone SecB [Thiohalocapsa sp.]